MKINFVYIKYNIKTLSIEGDNSCEESIIQIKILFNKMFLLSIILILFSQKGVKLFH